MDRRKPTYIDKTFAPDRKTALALFELARNHGTPVYSSSALRFAKEYTEADRQGIETICSIGPGKFDNYSIHQIEPIIALMGGVAQRIMWIGTPNSPALLIRFEDGRQATLHQLGWDCPFSLTASYAAGHAKVIKPDSDYFRAFMKSMLAFFETGEPNVAEMETVAIVTIIEYGFKASETPYQWVELPS